jgi:hypothetical protein
VRRPAEARVLDLVDQIERSLQLLDALAQVPSGPVIHLLQVRPQRLPFSVDRSLVRLNEILVHLSDVDLHRKIGVPEFQGAAFEELPFWWALSDSNREPPPCEGDAPPTERSAWGTVILTGASIRHEWNCGASSVVRRSWEELQGRETVLAASMPHRVMPRRGAGDGEV